MTQERSYVSFFTKQIFNNVQGINASAQVHIVSLGEWTTYRRTAERFLDFKLIYNIC